MILETILLMGSAVCLLTFLKRRRQRITGVSTNES